MFEESWQRLTLAQRAVLRAIVLESGRELLSADVRIAPPPARRLERAVGAGGAGAPGRRDERQGRYVVNDSLYREWLARRTF